MIARGASVILALVLAASCGGTGRAAASPQSTGAATPAHPTATYTIDVTDMMGAFPPATFYVLDKDGLKAIALLNHATRYTIPVGKDAQVAASGPAGRVYILDQVGDGARLRWFDLDNGTERATRTMPGSSVVSTGIGHGTLAIDDTTGIVYAALREANGIMLEAFDWFTLRPGGALLGGVNCDVRVVAAGGRAVLACMSAGLMLVGGDGATHKVGTPFPITAVAMLGDGTLMAGASDGSLVRLARQQTTLETVNTLKDYGKGLIPDGIAVNAGCCFYFGITDPKANDVQVRTIAGGTMLLAFPSISQPVGGFFVQAPFAYFVIGGRARHVDINQGFGEVMADLGPSAVPGAVANR